MEADGKPEAMRKQEQGMSMNQVLRKAAELFLAGAFLVTLSCGGGGSTGVGGAVTSGVYSSGNSTTGVVAGATVTGAASTNFVDATLYVSSGGAMTFIDMTAGVTCHGSGSISGSTVSGTLNCSIPGQSKLASVNFTGTMNGASLTGSYTMNGTTYNFSMPQSSVATATVISLNQTFTVSSSNCPAYIPSNPNIQATSGMGYMCPTSGSITVANGSLSSGSMTLSLPVPSQGFPIATNCVFTMSSATQTITFTGGSFTAMPGVTNVYTASNVTGTMNFQMTYSISGSGCSAAGVSQVSGLTQSMSGSFTIASGNAALINTAAGSPLLVLGGAVTATVSGSTHTFTVPNTAL